MRLSPKKNLVAANVPARIRNDECEYSHGRARNKATGENVGELFVRRALAQKSMETGGEREKERKSAREIYEVGRDEAERLRRNDREPAFSNNARKIARRERLSPRRRYNVRWTIAV